MGVFYSLIGCSLNVLYGFLTLEPSLILPDEPTAMIALRLSREIYDVIKTLPDAGISVVLVDRNVRQCAAVSEYMYVLNLGPGARRGRPRQLRRRHPAARHDRRTARRPGRLRDIGHM